MGVVKVPSITEIDVTKLTFSDVKSLDMGAKMVNVSYGDHPCIFKLPSMKNPFGLSSYNEKKWSIDVSINSENKDVEDKIKELETHIINTACDNSIKWLGSSENDPEVVEELFTSNIKYSVNPKTKEINDKYPNRLKLQIPFTNGVFTCKAYNSNKQYLDVNTTNIPKGCYVGAVVQLTGVWIAAGKFGYTLRIQQMKIDNSDSNAVSFDTYAFQEDPDEQIDD